MRPTVKYLTSACAGALLLACADIGHRGEPPAQPAQVAGTADDAYMLGRQQHMAMRFPAAIDFYQAALRVDPRHVNATNGLATLYAERGDLPRAIVIWQQLTDRLTSAPGTAFLHSNLGYAHLLNGDYQQAVAALERACVLDPLNHRAWRHLGGALDKLGQAERAQLMYKQAAALEQHDFKSDYTLVKGRSVTAIDGAIGVVGAQDGWAATEVRRTGSGMFELRRAAPASALPVAAVAAAPVAAPVAALREEALEGPSESPAAITSPVPDPGAQFAPEPELAAAAGNARLEIRNGNGVTGMARRLARKMGDASLRVVRLSNQKGFNVERTRVEYQSAFREAATRLAERFAGATVLEVDNCAQADVRLVIGHDLVRSKIEARRIIKAALARAAAKAG